MASTSDWMDDCSRWVAKYNCRLIAVMFSILLPSVGGGIVLWAGFEEELALLAYESKNQGRAMSELAAETRETADMTQTALAGIQEQLAVIQFRLSTDGRVIVTMPPSASGGAPEHAAGRHQ